MTHKELIDYLKKSKEIVSDDLFGESSEDTNDYDLKDSVFNKIIDDYTMSLIEGGVL